MLSNKILNLVLVAVVAYCCGNFNGAIITSQAQYKSDIREMGSGNAGLTNFYRCYGKAKLAFVVAIDITKAVVATLTGGILMQPFGMVNVGQALALLFVIAGHMFPMTYGFRGGKGVLSGCGALAVIDWRLMLLLLAAYVLIVAVTRYSSLGSITVTALMPVGVWFITHDLPATILIAVSAALVIFMHRANIVRLLHGTESKLNFGGKK